LDVEADIENPTESCVLERLQDQRGEVYAHNHDVVQKMGIVSKDTSVSQADLTETVADPDHELWQNRPDHTDDRVISQEDALQELERAYANLKEKGLVEESDQRSPPAMCRLNVSDA
jgi:hypothetical protein